MSQLNNITALVQQVKERDMTAMRALYDLYAKEMLATSYRITNDLQESEDILQEAFLSSFQKINQLEENRKYPHWLKRIVINQSLALLKKRVKFKELDFAVDEAIDIDEDSWYKGISFKEIKKAIQQLPEGCRQVFSLFLLEDYKHQEIATALGISISTSKSQYRYALKLMRQKLKDIK